MSKLYERLNASNWSKGRLISPDGTRCLLGHLILGEVEDITMVYSAIYSLFPERTTDPLGRKGSMTNFNDHPETTLEDVIRVLKVADV